MNPQTQADMMNHRARIAPTKLAMWAERMMEKTAPTVEGAARKVAESSVEAAVAALVRSGRCCRCGRKLTDPTSVEAGIGPDCQDDFGGRRAWEAYLSGFVAAARARAQA